MNFLKGFVVLIALGLTGPALADFELYTGVTIGISDADAKTTDIANALTAKGYDIQSVSIDSDDSGWRFLTGLRFTDIFAVELGYIDLGNASTQVQGDILTTQTGQFAVDVANAVPVMPRGLTLAGVARFTPGQVENLSFVVKLGVIDADSERRANAVRGANEDNAGAYYGVGAGWDFNDQWRGVVGYEMFNLPDSTSYWSAGVEFKLPKY